MDPTRSLELFLASISLVWLVVHPFFAIATMKSSLNLFKVAITVNPPYINVRMRAHAPPSLARFGSLLRERIIRAHECERECAK